MQSSPQQLQKFKIPRELEEFQESHQESQKIVFREQNPGDHQ